MTTYYNNSRPLDAAAREEDEEETPTTTVTVVESHMVIPSSSLAMVTRQQKEQQHPFLTQEMVAVFALEDPNHHYSEQELFELRCTQAEMFQEVVGKIALDLKRNILQVGYMLIQGDRIGLNTYLQITSMQDWLSQLGIKRPMQRLAVRLAKISPYLESLGFDPQTILSPDMGEAQAIYLGSIQQDATRQIKTMIESGARKALTGESSPAVEEEDFLNFDTIEEDPLPSPTSSTTPTSSGKVETPYFDQLSKGQQEAIQEKALEEYVTRARVEVKRVLALSAEDLITETQRTQQGKPVIPTFAITHLAWNERKGECTGVFTLKYSHLHDPALRQKKHDIYFRVDGMPDTIPLESLPDVLAQLMQEGEEEDEDELARFHHPRRF